MNDIEAAANDTYASVRRKKLQISLKHARPPASRANVCINPNASQCTRSIQTRARTPNMNDPLRRAKLCDTAVVALLLVIFTVVPFVLLFTDQSRHFEDDTLQTAYVICIAVSWPFLLIGAAPLAFYWRMDRALDSKYFSSARRAQLARIIAATVCIAIGCLLLIGGQAVWIVAVSRQKNVWASLVFGAISIFLLAWITHCVARIACETRRAMIGLRDVSEQLPPVSDGDRAASMEGPASLEIQSGLLQV